MILKFLTKLMPFYIGMFIGYLTFLQPQNVWIYGFFGGFMVAIFIMEDISKEKENGQD